MNVLNQRKWRSVFACLLAAVATLCAISYAPAVFVLPPVITFRAMFVVARGWVVPILLFRAAIDLWYPL